MQIPSGTTEKTMHLPNTECPVCGEELYLWYVPSLPIPVYLVACTMCGKVFYNGESAADALKTIKLYRDDETDDEKDVFISPQAAYEMNKTRDTCVLCGAKTVEKSLFSSVIMYCPCVEKQNEHK